MDRFWNSDLDVIEATFLGRREVTSLPVYTDRRVPPAGRVEIDRIVNVDTEVNKVLAKRLRAAKKPSLMGRLFDFLVFG